MTAPTVARIFRWYLNGMGVFLIAQTLTAEGIPSPSAYDRARNRHRTGIAWSKGAVQAILANPRYTGYQVWNKQHKAETLLDVDDVALGYETKLKWNERDQWIWSDRPAHPAIVDKTTFSAVQERRARRGPSSDRPRTRTPHPYALRSLLVHHQCGRRMQGTWNHGHAHYRCRYPQEYAIANLIDHPLTVYLREDAILPDPDAWLTTAFGPNQLRTTLDALAAQQPSSPRTRQPLPTRSIGRSRPATADSPSTAPPWKLAPIPSLSPAGSTRSKTNAPRRWPLSNRQEPGERPHRPPHPPRDQRRSRSPRRVPCHPPQGRSGRQSGDL
ncbi:recombinase family protein [Frankia sp. Mgl5]|uniref:recombinase family protein n=1 Tax=Frankia sp. Mgl5 TaxID=2933793 RepID=UPI00200E6A77|nr:recombinase family protein [Frankia sp. Mgl5]MCK9929620.1 recombinase family protein [Frankia sp. Mgl5]